MNIEAVKPQAMTLNAVHPEYAKWTPEEVHQRAYARLQEYIDAGRPKARNVVNSIFNDKIEDDIVVTAALHVDVEEGKRLFHALVKDRRVGLHQHALDQLAAAAGKRKGSTRNPFPQALRDLQARGEDWSDRLGAHMLGELLRRRPAGEKYLVRSVGGQARAVLSDAYKPIDNRPTAEALIEAADREGAVIVDGLHGISRTGLKVVRAKPIEVFPGEWAVLGFDYSNSDYGDGASDWRLFILRLLCLNGATVESVLRKVHLGKRASADALISADTRRKMAEADSAVAKDLVRGLLSQETSDKLVAQIRAANERSVAPDKLEDFLAKRMNKGEAKLVVDKFNSPDVEEVPAGQNAWRFSNAISWLAKNTEDDRRRMDLERAAGEAMAVGG